jgi:hypothetical protein
VSLSWELHIQLSSSSSSASSSSPAPGERGGQAQGGSGRKREGAGGGRRGQEGVCGIRRETEREVKRREKQVLRLLPLPQYGKFKKKLPDTGKFTTGNGGEGNKQTNANLETGLLRLSSLLLLGLAYTTLGQNYWANFSVLVPVIRQHGPRLGKTEREREGKSERESARARERERARARARESARKRECARERDSNSEGACAHVHMYMRGESERNTR